MDPGSGRTNKELKKLSARSALIVGGYDNYRRLFIVHAWASRATTFEMRKQIFEVNEKYNVKEFGIEANAQQSLFVRDVWDYARANGIRIPLSAKYQPGTMDKDFRVRAAVYPKLSNGQLLIHPGLLELITELESFPMSPLKDLPDALASLCAMVPPPIPQREINEQLEVRLHILRQTAGVPLEYIERVARGEA